jgi:hypothetical protein
VLTEETSAVRVVDGTEVESVPVGAGQGTQAGERVPLAEFGERVGGRFGDGVAGGEAVAGGAEQRWCPLGAVGVVEADGGFGHRNRVAAQRPFAVQPGQRQIRVERQRRNHSDV